MHFHSISLKFIGSGPVGNSSGIGQGNGLASNMRRPLPESMMTLIYDAI